MVSSRPSRDRGAGTARLRDRLERDAATPASAQLDAVYEHLAARVATTVLPSPRTAGNSYEHAVRAIRLADVPNLPPHDVGGARARAARGSAPLRTRDRGAAARRRAESANQTTDAQKTGSSDRFRAPAPGRLRLQASSRRARSAPDQRDDARGTRVAYARPLRHALGHRRHDSKLTGDRPPGRNSAAPAQRGVTRSVRGPSVHGPHPGSAAAVNPPD